MTRGMTPLLLVGHGTRDEAGAAAFGRFVERLRTRVPVDVAGGFIELSAPPLTDAVAELYAAGHRRVAAVPLVLVAAGHAKGDMPAALNRERERHPGLTYSYGRPLGPHPTLLALLEERLDAVLAPAERADTAVLLVGRGSTDPDANAEVCKAARLLWEGRGLAMVEPAFVSLARPARARGPRTLPAPGRGPRGRPPVLPVPRRTARPRRRPGQGLRGGRGALRRGDRRL